MSLGSDLRVLVARDGCTLAPSCGADGRGVNGLIRMWKAWTASVLAGVVSACGIVGSAGNHSDAPAAGGNAASKSSTGGEAGSGTGGTGGTGGTTSGATDAAVPDGGAVCTPDVHAPCAPYNPGLVGNTCADDWAMALSRYSTCQQDAGFVEPYLAACGPYYAIVMQYYEGTSHTYFDASGKLLGTYDFDYYATPQVSCTAFDPSFTVAPSYLCTPLVEGCPPAPRDF